MSKELTRLTREAVARLVAETGHVLEIDDFAEIAALDALARLILNPEDQDELDLLAFPVRVGRTWLYPITLGGSLWLEERAQGWFADLPLFADLSVAFLLAHGRTPEVLEEITDRPAAMKAIKKWRRGLGCTYKELMAGVTQALPDVDDDAPDGDNERAKYGPIIALLCREYGGTPEHWMWTESTQRVTALINEHRRRIEDEAEADYKAAQKSGATGLRVPRTLRLQRNVDFDRMIKALGARWRETSQSE